MSLVLLISLAGFFFDIMPLEELINIVCHVWILQYVLVFVNFGEVLFCTVPPSGNCLLQSSVCATRYVCRKCIFTDQYKLSQWRYWPFCHGTYVVSHCMMPWWCSQLLHTGRNSGQLSVSCLNSGMYSVLCYITVYRKLPSANFLSQETFSANNMQEYPVCQLSCKKDITLCVPK